MRRNDLRIPDYLGHILQAIERIAQYTGRLRESEFLSNTLVQDAVVRNIEIIGEAARNIERASPAFIATHASIPWSEMIAMRNRVTHGYMTLDVPLVWKTIQGDLPSLEKRIPRSRWCPGNA